jgi:hypothetical protein
MPELVEDHCAILFGVGIVPHPAEVHGRLVDREVGRIQGVATQRRPGAFVREEGDADLRGAVGHELQLDVGVLFPFPGDLAHLLLHPGAAVQEAATQGAAVGPLLGVDQRHPGDVRDAVGLEDLLTTGGFDQLAAHLATHQPFGIHVVRNDALEADVHRLRDRLQGQACRGLAGPGRSGTSSGSGCHGLPP